MPAGLVSGERAPFLAAANGLPAVSSHGPCVCVRVEQALVSLPLLIRTLVLSGQGPIQTTSFNLNYTLKGPNSKQSWEVGARISTHEGGST